MRQFFFERIFIGINVSILSPLGSDKLEGNRQHNRRQILIRFDAEH